VLAGGGEVRVFYQVLVALRRQTVPALDPGSEQRERAEVLFHEAASIVSETLERAEAHGRMQLAARADLLAGAVSTLTDWPTRDFSRMLAGELPKLGIALLYVASFVRAADTSRARLFLAFDAARKLCVDNSSETFASGGLMPTAVAPGDRPVAVVVAPLSFEGVSLGFLLVELSSREPSPYYVLASLISNALHLARRDDSAVDVISTLPPAAPPPVTAPPSLEEN
jgi:hypothetical protein